MSNSKIYKMPFDWDFVDDNTLNYDSKSNMSEEEVKEMVNQALSEALEDTVDGAVDEAINNMDIKLEGDNLLYKLIVNGSENGEINIPKDQFLKSTSYDSENKKLIFVMETLDGETTTEVSISDLVASIEDGVGQIQGKITEITEKNTEQDAALADKADVSALSTLATKAEVEAVDAKVDAIEIPDISGLAVKSEVTEEINSAVDGLNQAIEDKADKSDLETLAVKSAVDEAINSVVDTMNAAIVSKANKSELETLATKAEVEAIEIPDVSGLAVKSEVSEEINAVSDALATFESQTATALDAKADKTDLETLAVKTEVTEEINSAVDGLNQALADKADADDVYTKVESDEIFQLAGDYVPVEDYNELVRKFAALENYVNIFIKDREEKMDEIINNMDADNNSVVIETPMESIVVPETTVAYTITAPLENNSTVELTSPKYMTLFNTSDEPVSTSIGHTFVEGESTSATTVYLAGEFDTLTLENVSPAVKSGYDAASVNNIVITENNVKNLTLALDIQDGATITNNSNANITIQDKNDMATTLTIVAPNSTVTLNGSSYEVLNATVGTDTLIIKKNVAHIDELNVSKGNVIVEVPRQSLIAEKIGEYTIADGYTIDYLHDEIGSTNVANLAKEGTHTLVEDVVRSGNFSVGTFSTDDMIWELNGHNITSSNTRGYGLFRLRGSAHLEVNDSVGTGIVKNTDDDYGLWAGTADCKIVVNGGNFEASTHVLYAEKGTIEVNGGTFKLTNWETADKDENGNLKFLINCHDADYVSGAAKIIVRGGKFYDFDPANCAAEGVGTSFVAEGYGSVMTTEIIDGVEHRVYEVKPINN